jgi:4-hydroxy-tetrahydrodipicolinate synthase
MTIPYPPFQGVWLPLVTPFKDGELDETSFRRMVGHYAGRVDGFIVAATTGEGLALSRDETRRIAEWTAEVVAAKGSRTSVVIGLGGASTASVVAAVRAAEAWPTDGFLVTCPYYVRPSQDGLRLHFEAIADSSAANILIYNIPYRAGVNMENDTMLQLAERPNIVGVKDCCANTAQTLDLIQRKPAGFSVLTGEDAEFMSALCAGADGGVVASAHLNPEGFRELYRLARSGHRDEAERAWAGLATIAELLFAEPNPAPLKHCLWRMGLIDSPELRLPMTLVSAELAARLDVWIRQQQASSG